MSHEIAKQDFSFQISTLDQALDYARMISESDLAPKDYKGKPGNCLIAMQFGSEIGLKPMQAIQNIAIINGRPCVWGDAMLGLVMSNPLCEYVNERQEAGTAYCTVKRKGDAKEYTYEFSMDDAKKAGLSSKAGCWTQYPERMLQMRARGFALRDKFPDVLKGLSMREEVEDYIIEGEKAVNKNETEEKIAKLIEAKAGPVPLLNTLAFEDVHCMMNDATTIEELDKAAAYAKELSEDDKPKARAMYKTKYLKLVSALSGDVRNDSE